MKTTRNRTEVVGYADTRAKAFEGSRDMLMRHGLVLLMSAGGTTFLVREVGPNVWGGFVISYTLLVAADTIIARGVMAGLLRRAVALTDGLLRSAARLALLAGALAAAVIAGAAAVLPLIYSPPGLGALLIATSLTTVLYSARALPLTLLERDLRYRTVAISEVADMAVFYVVAIACVVAGFQIEGLVAATVARGVVSVAVIRVAARSPWLGNSARPAAEEILRFGLPLSVVTLVVAAEGLVPTLFIGRDEAAVGFLVLAVSLLGYSTAVGTVAQRVAVPGFARLTGPELVQAVERSVGLSTFLTLTVLVPLGALATLWVEPLLGEKWEGSASMFQVVGVAMLVGAPINVLIAALTATARTGAVLRIQILASATYVVVGAVLVLAIGPVGLAWGLVASRWLWAGALLARVKADLRVELPRSVVVCLLCGCVNYAGLVVAAHAGTGLLLGFALAAGVLWVVACRDLLARSWRSFYIITRPAGGA